jgi:tRNA G18 (ribose-2'-O)-methylase SpoU
VPLVPVPSLDDPRLDPYRDLKRTNHTRWADRFVVEGAKLAERLIDSDFPLVSFLVSEGNVQGFMAFCQDAPLREDRLRDVPVWVIPDARVEELVGFNFHRGVLGCAGRKVNPPLAALCGGEGAAKDRGATLVVCPDLHDPENLGGMFRVSAALGASGMLIGPTAADPLSRRVLRVSMGTALKLPFAVSTDVPGDLARLRGQGVEVAATVLDPAAEPLAGAARPAKLALVFGNEGHGLSAEVLAECDRKLTIPMAWGTDSLNVVVAAGIVLNHFRIEGSEA